MTTKAQPHLQNAGVLREMTPGLFLCAVIAATAFSISHLRFLSAVSPALLAVVLGIAFRALLGEPAIAQPGVRISMRQLLRIAVVLLGLRVTFAQIQTMGLSALMVLAATVVATLAFSFWMSKLCRVEWRLGMLLGSGTAICGASAIVAASSTLTARHEDIAYGLAAVTIAGSLSMVLYPILGILLELDPHRYGLWVGASLHEVAQVVVAGYQLGPEAGETATVAKLVRVLALAPTVAVLGYLAQRRLRGGPDQPARVQLIPWFVAGFAVMVVLGSVIAFPDWLLSGIQSLVSFLMAMALAAIGIETDLGRLAGKGMAPLLFSALLTIFIAVFSLALILLFI
ncbi:YeiH family protein [Pelagibacterium nitratireducens]|uniref:YeiH family protein n=1 Tax=Pelagibacterium nitratireducens TaxID=1046114 RepID=A0ABZ2I066_9HYPH